VIKESHLINVHVAEKYQKKNPFFVQNVKQERYYKISKTWQETLQDFEPPDLGKDKAF
jgi:hypothetical protein